MLKVRLALFSFICCAPWLFSSSAHAGIAWAWAQFETGTFTANPNYSFNDAGGPITITQTGTGTYRVTFEGQDMFGGNAQVMAYGDTDRMCTIVGWGSAGVSLKCWAPNGTLMNSKFVVTFVNYQDESGGPSKGFYLWNNLPSSNGTPSLSYQWSSSPITNGSQAVSRVSVGVYDIAHGWTAPSTTFPIVSAYSATKAIHCMALRVNLTGGPNGSGTRVTCFDHTGAPADSMFALSVSSKSVFGFHASGLADRGGGLIVNPSNPNPGSPTVAPDTTLGVFKARFPSLIPSNKSTVLVSNSQFQRAITRLVISRWTGFTSGTGTEVTILCFGAATSGPGNVCDPTVAYGTNQ